MNARATLANLAWLAASAPAHRRFARALCNPASAQSNWLRTHLAANSRTEYGRAHGASSIRSYADFARQFPIASYADLEPWIDRLKSGERNLLTHEPVSRLVPTSGGMPRFCVTARSLWTARAGVQPVAASVTRVFGPIRSRWSSSRISSSAAPSAAVLIRSPALRIGLGAAFNRDMAGKVARA